MERWKVLLWLTGSLLLLLSGKPAGKTGTSSADVNFTQDDEEDDMDSVLVQQVADGSSLRLSRIRL